MSHRILLLNPSVDALFIRSKVQSVMKFFCSLCKKWQGPSVQSIPIRYFPVLSSWLENELPEGFTVFNVEPDSLNARRKLRTTNMVEFQNKELKKRTRCIRVFPNKESLLRIATALLIELDEKWLANGKVYLKG